MLSASTQSWVHGLGLRGAVRFDEPMARHCSWRVGGRAACSVAPADVADLLSLLRGSPSTEPLTWIGLGSNTLVRDGGLPGVVVFTHPGLTKLALETDGAVTAEAGVPCAKVAKLAETHGLRSAGFLSGIPGSIGGALAMNAGAFGSAVWEFVEALETVNREGALHTRAPAEYQVAYRAVSGPANEWFLRCRLRFGPTAANADTRSHKALLEQRNASQPIGAASCGSVFKNPPGDFAGRLIEATGLKGFRHGGCVVSDKHANFIINDGGATATELEELIGLLRDQVAQKFNVLLEPEVRIVGVPIRRSRAVASDD